MLGLIDGFLQPFLNATSKLNNQRFSIFGEVDAIVWPRVNLVLTQIPRSNSTFEVALVECPLLVIDTEAGDRKYPTDSSMQKWQTTQQRKQHSATKQ